MIPLLQRGNHSAFSGPFFSLPSGPTEKLSNLNFQCLTFSSPHTLGFSRELQVVEDITTVLQHSQDEVYLAPSSCQDLCDFHQTTKTPASPPEEQFECCILDMDGECTH
jgi:hypothetical protein